MAASTLAHTAHSTTTTVAHHTSSVAIAPSSAGVDWVHEFGAMLVVIGLLWLAARYMKKRTGITAGVKAAPGQISVLSRQVLAKGISLAIVHVAAKDFLIGITSSGVTLLAEVDVTGHRAVDYDDEIEAFAEAASVEGGNVGPRKSVIEEKLDGQWTAGQLGGASPLQAWMAKLDGLREMTVRRS